MQKVSKKPLIHNSTLISFGFHPVFHSVSVKQKRGTVTLLYRNPGDPSEFSSGKDQAIPVQLFGRGGKLPPKDGPIEAGLALQVRYPKHVFTGEDVKGWNWKQNDR